VFVWRPEVVEIGGGVVKGMLRGFANWDSAHFLAIAGMLKQQKRNAFTPQHNNTRI
jgi:hypothetical protein